MFGLCIIVSEPNDFVLVTIMHLSLLIFWNGDLNAVIQAKQVVLKLS